MPIRRGCVDQRVMIGMWAAALLVGCGEGNPASLTDDAGTNTLDSAVGVEAGAEDGCIPMTCDAQCGSVSDGCGGTLDCGTCSIPSEWPCAFRPDESNTGPVGALDDYTGPTTITTPGTVLENFRAGGLVIEADNVTVRNFEIDAGSSYGISIASGHSGIVIEDGEIYNMDSAAILGVGYTGRRLNIHDSSGDGLKAQGTGGPTLIEHSYIHRLGKGDGAHADGNQTRGGSNITFRCNNIYMPYPGSPAYPGAPYKSNATFMLQLSISNFVIEYNWLTGGNYTVYGTSGVYVRHNRFGRYNGGWPSKEERRLRTGSFAEWENNVLEDEDL